MDAITVTPLARIATAGGDVLHALKQQDQGFVGFGEAYFSFVAPGAVKAWKIHKRMTMNVVVPMGSVRFVFHLQGGDAYREEEIGADRYVRLTVPPGIWFGFKGLGASENLILNIADIAHDPAEVDRLPISEIKYSWS
ncbi:MAG: dTDP-4-dehydrorhamnose 3,5-epimerase [Glaciimonas sp.]|nr:dTDP-4-dehydrorhamnose 3,5-epimerase [Glaciimonas sp.]